MKIVMITVIDTDKQFSDWVTYQIPTGKIEENLDLGDVLIACQKVLFKLVKHAKDEGEE